MTPVKVCVLWPADNDATTRRLASKGFIGELS
jgi:hypothetical protein